MPNPKQALRKAEQVLAESSMKGMKKVKSVKAKDGGTFEVYERPPKSGQDRYKMFHVFDNGKTLDLGTHPSADGALKFAKNQGITESTDEHIAAMNKLRLANKNKWWNYSSPDGSVKAKGYNTWVQRIEVTKNGKTYKASTTMDAPVSKFKAELKQILEARYDDAGYDVKDRWDGEKPRATGRDYFGRKMKAEPYPVFFNNKAEAEKYAKKVKSKVHKQGNNEFVVLVKEAKETAIDLARRVAKNHQHEKGLDATTANVIMQVYNAVSDANKAKMEKLSVKQLASIAFKLVK
jgi:hypothetical protein